MQSPEQLIESMKDLVYAAAWNAAVSENKKHLRKFRKIQREARKFAAVIGDKELDKFFKTALQRAMKNANAEGPLNHDLFDLREFGSVG